MGGNKKDGYDVSIFTPEEEVPFAGHPSLGTFAFCTETYAPNYDIAARMFAPGTGVPEDPATGSANGYLASYIVEHEYLGSSSVAMCVWHKASKFNDLQAYIFPRAKRKPIMTLRLEVTSIYLLVVIYCRAQTKLVN